MKDISFLFLLTGFKTCPLHAPIVRTGAAGTKDRLAWGAVAGRPHRLTTHRLTQVKPVPGYSDTAGGSPPHQERHRPEAADTALGRFSKRSASEGGRPSGGSQAMSGGRPHPWPRSEKWMAAGTGGLAVGKAGPWRAAGEYRDFRRQHVPSYKAQP